MTELVSRTSALIADGQGEGMKRESEFWDKIAAKYAASPIKDMAAYERTLDRAREYLDQGDRVLEVGCGTGTTALLLADAVEHLTASDLSASMIEIAGGKARDQGVENVTFVQASLPDASLTPASFDAVLAFNILHLVGDLRAVVRSLGESLKPGGVLISKTPCMAEQTRLWAIPLFFMRLVGYAPYVNLLTIAQLESVFEEEGFEIVETGAFPRKLNRFVVARKV